MKAPCVLIVFNRPELAVQAAQAIAGARPSHVFVVADGPRTHVPEDAARCREVRSLVEEFPWPCPFTRLYADTNMGCGKRVSSGLDAVFEQVDRAIILEDDCSPDPSFFPYCDELLERYANDERVMAISGDNFQHGRRRSRYSYYFSKYHHCWGWATWRRAWSLNDQEMSLWPNVKESDEYRSWFYCERERRYWTHRFDLCHQGRCDTWDYPWTLSCWRHHGLIALPAVNLVQNIGVDVDATHTQSDARKFSVPAQGMGGRLSHPPSVRVNIAADRYTDRFMFSGNVRYSWRARMARLRWACGAQVRCVLGRMKKRLC